MLGTIGRGRNSMVPHHATAASAPGQRATKKPTIDATLATTRTLRQRRVRTNGIVACRTTAALKHRIAETGVGAGLVLSNASAATQSDEPTVSASSPRSSNRVGRAAVANSDVCV